MILIDLDKTLEMIGDLQTSNMEQRDTVCYVMEELEFSTELEVEAIPIKWINMWLLKRVFIWEATTTAYEKDRLQAIENIKYGFETMLKDWEKENETEID